MIIEVHCYAGYQAEQEPRRFFLEPNPIEVEAILDRWQGPDHRYFKVKGQNHKLYILRYDQQADLWELFGYGTPGNHEAGWPGNHKIS